MNKSTKNLTVTTDGDVVTIERTIPWPFMVGDEVIVTEGMQENNYQRRIDKITRTTKTMVMVGDLRFSRKTLYALGRWAFDATRIQLATPELRAEVEDEVEQFRIARLIRKRLNHFRISQRIADQPMWRQRAILDLLNEGIAIIDMTQEQYEEKTDG